MKERCRLTHLRFSTHACPDPSPDSHPGGGTDPAGPGSFLFAIHAAEHPFGDVVVLAERTRYDGVDIITDFPPDAVHAHPIFGWYEPE